MMLVIFYVCLLIVYTSIKHREYSALVLFLNAYMYNQSVKCKRDKNGTVAIFVSFTS